MKIVFFALASVLSFAAHAESIAVKLTTLSTDKDVSEHSPEVARTQAALTRGLTVCNFEGEEQLASAAWAMTKKIRDKGQYAEATDILEGVNAALLGAKSKQDCSEVLAMYTLNRIEGHTHSDAVTGARGLYRAMGLVQ